MGLKSDNTERRFRMHLFQQFDYSKFIRCLLYVILKIFIICPVKKLSIVHNLFNNQFPEFKIN